MNIKEFREAPTVRIRPDPQLLERDREEKRNWTRRDEPESSASEDEHADDAELEERF